MNDKILELISSGKLIVHSLDSFGRISFAESFDKNLKFSFENGKWIIKIYRKEELTITFPENEYENFVNRIVKLF